MVKIYVIPSGIDTATKEKILQSFLTWTEEGGELPANLSCLNYREESIPVPDLNGWNIPNN